jgi:predicted dinucleotide-binding enzyme
MRIGILGSGLMGGKLGTIFARAGHEVVFSYARSMEKLNEARRTTTRPSLVYCGDDKGSKGVAAELIRDVGFDPLDAGALRLARYTEPFALLVAELAYEGEGGPELAYRFEWFRK